MVIRMWMLTSISGVYEVILCEKKSARHIQEILNRLQSYSLVQCLCYWKHIQRLKMWQEFSQNNRPGRAQMCPSWRKPIHLHSGHWTKMQTLKSINVHMLVKTHSPGPNLTRNLTKSLTFISTTLHMIVEKTFTCSKCDKNFPKNTYRSWWIKISPSTKCEKKFDKKADIE